MVASARVRYTEGMQAAIPEGIKMVGTYEFVIRDGATGRVKRIYRYRNLVPTAARTMIADNLTAASPANTMLITHCVLGSSTTAPANGDTQLGTETYRNTIASLSKVSNVAYATGFFTTTETSGTYRECGIVSNGTGTANTGVLISHVSINITKTTSETLTLDWTLTLS